ncbi:MAG: hypothetical protein WKF44_07505, partial [Rubrobacteraceae bacterium]
MTNKNAAIQPTTRTLSHEGRAIALVEERGRVLLTSPSPGVGLESFEDRSLYYSLVVEHAHERTVETGRLLDVHDADPDQLYEFLTRRDRQPLHDGREGWTSTLNIDGVRGTLTGDIQLLGADASLRPRLYGATLENSDGVSHLTLPERSSWIGSLPLRVAPAKTILLVGLDETNVELARGLRRAGLRTLLAQQSGARKREVLLDLRDSGFPVFEVESAEELRQALEDYGQPDAVVLGFGSDTKLTPEGTVEQESPLDAANERLAAATSPEGTLVLDQFPGELSQTTGPSTLPLPQAAALEFLLPVLDVGDEFPENAVEATLDLTLPTTVPFGEKNRHSTDDVAFKANPGLEKAILAALESLDSSMLERLKAVENPAAGRSRALAVRQQLGPWTTHLAGTLTVRARKAGGEYLQAHEYEQRLRDAGDVRVLPLPETGKDVHTLLDGTYLQNIVFSKLRAIHGYRPAAVVAPLTDETFQVVFLVPQVSYGVVGRLRSVLAASGLAGEDLEGIRATADEALDLPR